MIPRELLRKLKKLEIVTRRLVNQQLAGQYHSVFKGRGMDFDKVRLYQDGDDIRHIDWNVSARTGGVFVKQFVEERELTVFLLVDASASQGFGSVTQRKREVAAEVAAMLAFSAIKNNDRVGLIVFTDDIELFVPPKKGRKHVMRLISEVLTFTPRGRGTDVAAALDYLSRITSRKSVAFVLSDFLASDYLRSLTVTNRRHDLVPIVITDPMEEDLPDLGLCYFEDPESGQLIAVDTSSAKVRRQYRARAAQERSQRERAFRRSNVDFINIYTHRSYIEPLITYFRLRAQRH